MNKIMEALDAIKKIITALAPSLFAIGILAILIFATLSLLNTNAANEKLAILNVNLMEHGKQIQAMTAENQAMAVQNGAWANENRSLADQIAALKTEAKDNATALQVGLEEAKKLADARPPAPVECKEIITYMQKEIDAYVANFSLAIRDRDTWKAIAGDFDLAYQNQVKISTNLQATVLNLQTTVDLISSDSAMKSEIIKDLQKEIKINQFKSHLFVGGMVAIVIGVTILGVMK